MDTSPPAIRNPVQFALHPYNRLWPTASVPKQSIPSSIMHQRSGLPQEGVDESALVPTYIALKTTCRTVRVRRWNYKYGNGRTMTPFPLLVPRG